MTSGTHSITAPMTLAGNLDISPSAGTLLAISGNIGESVTGLSLTLDNAGTLILSGSDGYTGGTYVTAGTIDVEAANALPNGGALTVGAGAGSLFASPVAGGLVPASAPASVPEPGTLAMLMVASSGFRTPLGRPSESRLSPPPAGSSNRPSLVPKPLR